MRNLTANAQSHVPIRVAIVTLVAVICLVALATNPSSRAPHTTSKIQSAEIPETNTAKRPVTVEEVDECVDKLRHLLNKHLNSFLTDVDTVVPTFPGEKTEVGFSTEKGDARLSTSKDVTKVMSAKDISRAIRSGLGSTGAHLHKRTWARDDIMYFVFEDNTVVKANMRSCKVTGVYWPVQGMTHPSVQDETRGLDVVGDTSSPSCRGTALCCKGDNCCTRCGNVGCPPMGSARTLDPNEVPAGTPSCDHVQKTWGDNCPSQLDSTQCPLQAADLTTTQNEIKGGLGVVATSLKIGASIFAGFKLAPQASLSGIGSAILGIAATSDEKFNEKMALIQSEMTRLAKCAVFTSDITALQTTLQTIQRNLEPDDIKFGDSQSRVNGLFQPNAGKCNQIVANIEVVNDRTTDATSVIANLLAVVSATMTECAYNYGFHAQDLLTLGYSTETIRNNFYSQLRDSAIEINNAIEVANEYWRDTDRCWTSDDQKKVDTRVTELRAATYDVVEGLFAEFQGPCTTLWGQDFQGNDISSSSVTNLEACQNNCVNNAECQFYTYNGDVKKCWLKRAARLNTAVGTSVVTGSCGQSPFRVCYRFENYDIPGFDIDTRITCQSPRACEETCLGTPGCSIFTYNTDTKQCFLKTSDAQHNLRAHSDGHSGVCRPLADAGTCTAVRNADAPGNDISSSVVVSLDACYKNCIANSNCKFFTFRESDKRCWLKRDAKSFTTKSGHFSGACMKTKKVCDRYLSMTAGYYDVSGRTNMDATELLACELMCMQNSACYFYVFNRDTKKCSLKWSGTGAQPSTNAQTVGRCYSPSS